MRKAPALAIVLLVAIAGCSRCGKVGGPPPERFLAGDASLAVVVPRLAGAQEQARQLVQTALGFASAAGLPAQLAAVRAQLGVDLLEPSGLAQAGLDPDRGAGLAFSERGPPLLVLPVADADKLAALVERLARDALGAGVRQRAAAAGGSLEVFRRRQGDPPALALLVTGGAALLAPGADGPASLAAAAARPGAESLASSASFAQARAAIGDGQAAILFVPPGSSLAARSHLARDGAALGVSAAPARLALRGALLLPPQRMDAWRSALAAGAAEDAVARLPSDAFLVGRIGGDPAAVLRRALGLLPQGSAALSRAGLDPNRDLGDLLAPGAVASVSLAPSFEVAAASRASELGVADPFRLVHLAAELRVRDVRGLELLMARLAQAGPSLGFTVGPLSTGGFTGWRIARGGAELQLALQGDRLRIAGGAGRLEALLAGATRGYAPPTGAARAALHAGAGAVLDFGQLVSSFRSLPPQAYGSGPDAFVMRSLIERVVEPAEGLLAASLRVDLAAAGAALGELVVEARPRAPPGASR